MEGSKGQRVLVVSRLFSPEVGAAAYRLKALADALQADGAQVEVITSRPPKDTSAQSFPYPVRRWPVLRDAGGNVRGYVQYMSFDIPAFFRILFGHRHDVMVVEPPPTTGLVVAAAGALRRTPFVYFSADVSSSAAKGIGVKGPVLKVLTALERFVLRRARGILAVSEGVCNEVRELAEPSADVCNVGTGVDTNVFSFPGEDKDTEGRYFVYAGTMSEIQGAGVFVDAFLSIASQFQDARLVMFGQGVELEELQRRAAPAASQIVFNPPASGETIAAWQRSALANLASVRPGRGYDFAFATKALAGLAAGAPAIYAGVGPLKQIIDENSLGYACDWDAEQVALAMKGSIENPPTREQRTALSAWVEDNYSLRAVGKRASAEVLKVSKLR